MIRPAIVAAAQRELRRRGLGLAARMAWGPAPTHWRRPLWLFGSNVGLGFTDNSRALFLHLIATRPEVPATWVIDRDAPVVGQVEQAGPVLFRDDLSTYVASLAASVMVISHGVHDIPLCSSTSTGALKVRLGHGLTALKKTKPRRLHSNRSANSIFGLVTVASEFEKSIKLEWGIDASRIVVTGLPRFDELLMKAAQAGRSQRRILYMPTWRDWVGTPADAAVAMAPMFRFLNSSHLHSTLRSLGVVLDVFLHPILHQILEDGEVQPATDVVRVAASGTDVQDLIARCEFMITDYSSTAWDALYVDRPVLFFPFDRETYVAHRGAYLDLATELPGPSADTPDDLVALVSEQLVTGGLSTQARKWQERAFAFRDGRNSERVAAAIRERLTSSQGST